MSIHESILVPILVIVFLMLGPPSKAASDLATARKSFHEAVLDKSRITDFYQTVCKMEKVDATILAYQAVAQAMSAKLEWNPIVKYEKVKKYDTMMEMAISRDPNNPELLFLRLSVEYNLPGFLGFSVHLDQDKEEILKQLSSMEDLRYDPDFSRFILYFLRETDMYTEEELSTIKVKLDLI